MSDTKYKLFAERLLLYNITSEPTELSVPILSQSPTVLSYLPTSQPVRIPIVISDCNVNTYVAISVATSVFTTLCVIFAAYYLRERCKSRYLRDIASSSSSMSSSSSSHVIDIESVISEDVDELFWFEDVYNVDQEDVYNVDT